MVLEISSALYCKCQAQEVLLLRVSGLDRTCLQVLRGGSTYVTDVPSMRHRDKLASVRSTSRWNTRDDVTPGWNVDACSLVHVHCLLQLTAHAPVSLRLRHLTVRVWSVLTEGCSNTELSPAGVPAHRISCSRPANFAVGR